MPCLNILVIDDDELVCESLKMLIEAENHRASIALGGDAGLSKYRAGKYDLVLVDYFMPGMTGQQIAEAIKCQSSTPPVILVSAFPPREPSPVFDRIILKPISLAELRQTISSILGIQKPVAGMA